MAAVDAHPSHRSQPSIVNLPMILRCAVATIITPTTGTATTPLITALQYADTLRGSDWKASHRSKSDRFLQTTVSRSGESVGDQPLQDQTTKFFALPWFRWRAV